MVKYWVYMDNGQKFKTHDFEDREEALAWERGYNKHTGIKENNRATLSDKVQPRKKRQPSQFDSVFGKSVFGKSSFKFKGW